MDKRKAIRAWIVERLREKQVLDDPNKIMGHPTRPIWESGLPAILVFCTKTDLVNDRSPARPEYQGEVVIQVVVGLGQGESPADKADDLTQKILDALPWKLGASVSAGDASVTRLSFRSISITEVERSGVALVVQDIAYEYVFTGEPLPTT